MKRAPRERGAVDTARQQRVGEAIRAWRVEQAKLTCEQLAQRLGLSLRTIARFEAGEGDPRFSDLDAMEKICSGLIESVFHISGESC
jgi:transcriptional regulator with XRE-family HTH domain